MGDKFPEYYVGKSATDQDLPFNAFANGSAIANGHYRLFGAVLPYPKDIVSSQPEDFETYVSVPFVYNSVESPREFHPPGIIVYGSLIGYNTLSHAINSPYDTVYVYLTLQSPFGIFKGDVASITLPSELEGFPAPFNISTKAGVDIGQVSIRPDTNELQVRFFKDMDAVNVKGNVGIFTRLKNPTSYSLGRHFFKFSNLGSDHYRYLNFRNAGSTAPRIGCRNDGKDSWLDVDIPSIYAKGSRVNITASTVSGTLFDWTKLKIVESTGLDGFGNITTFNADTNSTYNILQGPGQNAVSVDLKSSAESGNQMMRTSIPLFYGKASGASAKVQIFTGTKDITFNLDCRFDSSGIAGNAFTFSGTPLFMW